ncbi:hypothetical protein [Curtobacterium sp. Leaf261]|uniref:hypothetical protein n=1 Tax=Curtobacterium sp. Leaf261 TaxID=1736311 RepID=UPI0006FA9D52|nr:hypothetical protein [Curtobacterium sp. Leaf261]
MTTRTTRRAITAVTIALVGAVVLAGCTDDAAGGSPSGSGQGSGSGSAAPKPVGSRVDIDCDVLVPQSVFAAYGETFTLVTDATPQKDTPAADIAAQRGQVCVWRNGGRDTTVTLAVADLPDAAITKLEDSLFEDSNSVPTYTVEGYFDVTGGLGRADAFVAPYWVNVESALFTEPGTAQPVVDSVRAALAGSSSPSATASTTP